MFIAEASTKNNSDEDDNGDRKEILWDTQSGKVMAYSGPRSRNFELRCPLATAFILRQRASHTANVLSVPATVYRDLTSRLLL